MSTTTTQLPLFPLILDGVPPGLRQALTQEGISYVERAIGRLAGRYVLFDSRSGRCRGLAAGQVAIDVDTLRRSGEGDPFEDLLDERSATHCYRISGFDLQEQIARVDKRRVRRRLMKLLRDTIEKSGGIWLKLSPYPFPYRGVFNLRSNYGECGQAIDEALADVTGHERATSHYLCGSAFESCVAEARKFTGLDVGSLGQRPVIFDETEDNVVNLRQGIWTLRRLGLEPRGYASPEGVFSLPLLAALEVLGVPYNSTTAWCYDELPFFPGNSHVLQLPAHPVAVDRFPDGHWAPTDSTQLEPRSAWIEAMQDYFHALIDARYQSGEPLLLHRAGTPRLAGSREVARMALSAASRCGALWRTTLSELADWWRARAEVRVKVTTDGDQFSVTVDGRPLRHRLAAEYWRGDHVALVPIDDPTTRLSPSALAFQARRTVPILTPQRVDAAEPLPRMGRKQSATQSTGDDSSIRALRDWMTRTLRRPWE